ncbi:unnamed protein product [Haemonchus placei]|uniref:Secreted protein n=1 Tax=Haemonchus placei TaxID=6290 RepID=A0A0N4VZJ8_HAEPC|nr:unnamed protein product [Haemonchus placei]
MRNVANFRFLLWLTLTGSHFINDCSTMTLFDTLVKLLTDSLLNCTNATEVPHASEYLSSGFAMNSVVLFITPPRSSSYS